LVPLCWKCSEWRRVVPSPALVDIREARVIDFIVQQDVTVICAGGGGIPVVEREDGTLGGVEAVIDFAGRRETYIGYSSTRC
jgi:carbamate kinase